MMCSGCKAQNIYKAFDDLGLRQQKFAGEVLSVLILEDILGILLMVVLSAVAVSRQFQGMELVGSLFKLGFFLILWFVVGVYVIPIFLRKTHRLMNRETLLVVSIGLCFLLVVIAEKVGYSSAFGAFMMGSILAETLEAEQIERVVSPVKDLFGAIFFVSVGMLVDPAVLALTRRKGSQTPCHGLRIRRRRSLRIGPQRRHRRLLRRRETPQRPLRAQRRHSRRVIPPPPAHGLQRRPD